MGLINALSYAFAQAVHMKNQNMDAGHRKSSSHLEESSVVSPMLQQKNSDLKNLGPNRIMNVVIVASTKYLWNTSGCF